MKVKLMGKLLAGILVVTLCITSLYMYEEDAYASGETVTTYLATYSAEYEYNMGVEHAQFPSGNYTDNRRTNVLYYAISTDGESFTGLNNDRPILYPDNMCRIASPSLFRKADEADLFIMYNEDDGYYYMTGSYMQEDLRNAYDYVVIRCDNDCKGFAGQL